nr:MAG TPA: group II intron reverse transcriptase/maturase [Caudoviricetes sp.]
MSVLKNKRDLSDMEFYKNAIRMNQELVTWMMRNFGTQRNPRSVNQVIKNISEDDQKTIDDIFSKYGQSPNHEFVSEFPKWYVDRKRKRLLDLCDELIENITNANSIYPTEEFLHEEYAMRREFQTMAICNCKDIEQVLQGIKKITAELGLKLNEKKTQICRIDKGFNFLKQKIFITDTGKIVHKPNKSSFVREKRKLKSFKFKYDMGEMTKEEIENQYKSWRNNIVKFDCKRTMHNVDELYNELYEERNTA